MQKTQPHNHIFTGNSKKTSTFFFADVYFFLALQSTLVLRWLLDGKGRCSFNSRSAEVKMQTPTASSPSGNGKEIISMSQQPGIRFSQCPKEECSKIGVYKQTCKENKTKQGNNRPVWAFPHQVLKLELGSASELPDCRSVESVYR